MAMADSREALLTGLLRLGCVEISEPDDKLADPAWAERLRREDSPLIQRRSEITDVKTALSALERYGAYKDGMFLQRRPISQEEFLGERTVDGARRICREIVASLQDLLRLLLRLSAQTLTFFPQGLLRGGGSLCSALDISHHVLFIETAEGHAFDRIILHGSHRFLWSFHGCYDTTKTAVLQVSQKK